MAGQMLSPAAAKKRYQVNQPNTREGIRQSLYDYQTYAQAGQSQIKFFQTPVGQSNRTKADTNMLSAGSLPAPQSFLVQSIQIWFEPGAAVLPTIDGAAAQSAFINDVWKVMRQGAYVELTIGSKTYFTEAPLARFPCANRLSVATSSSANLVAAGSTINSTEYAATAGAIYKVPGYYIPQNQNFDVTIYWPSVVSISAAGKIGVIMDGVLYRSVQ